MTARRAISSSCSTRGTTRCTTTSPRTPCSSKKATGSRRGRSLPRWARPDTRPACICISVSTSRTKSSARPAGRIRCRICAGKRRCPVCRPTAPLTCRATAATSPRCAGAKRHPTSAATSCCGSTGSTMPAFSRTASRARGRMLSRKSTRSGATWTAMHPNGCSGGCARWGITPARWTASRAG